MINVYYNVELMIILCFFVSFGRLMQYFMFPKNRYVFIEL